MFNIACICLQDDILTPHSGHFIISVYRMAKGSTCNNLRGDDITVALR
jgi:hypothetical protein